MLAGSAINNANYGLLIFDVHNEYAMDLKQHPKFKDRLAAYNAMSKVSEARQLSLAYSDIQPADIIACAAFTEAQLDALYKLSAVLGENWLEHVVKYDTKDIIDELAVSTGQKFQSRTISKIESICWNLKQELNILGEESTTHK